MSPLSRFVRSAFVALRSLMLGLIPPRVAGFMKRRIRLPFGDKYYGKRALQYDLDREHQPSWTREYLAVEELLSDVGERASVLDVPAGSGRFFPIYKSKGMRVTAFDISEDMLEVARERAGAESLEEVAFVGGDARKMGFSNDSFDYVVCFRFLQSIVSYRDAQLVIAEIARVCKGFAILHLQICQEQSSMLPAVRGWEPMKGNLDRHQLERLLSQCGLSISRSITTTAEDGKESIAVFCRVD